MPGAPQLDLTPYLAADRILFLDDGCSKADALQTLAERTGQHDNVRDADAFVRAIFEREEVSSTGIGGGIAVPHAKIPTNDGFTISIGISRSGLDFCAKDGEPVHVVVMIAASDREREAYLKVLASVASRLKRQELCTAMQARRHRRRIDPGQAFLA